MSVILLWTARKIFGYAPDLSQYSVNIVGMQKQWMKIIPL